MKFLITQTEQFKVVGKDAADALEKFLERDTSDSSGVEFFGVIDRTVEEVDD